MRLLDEQYTLTPFYGVEKMTAYLRRQGYPVNAKRVRRLLRIMGITAIYAKPRLSQSNKEHQVYPYLLRNMIIRQPNEVWSTDITYIRLRQGFIYLVAIIDWFSRYVLAWQISNTLDSSFCVETLEQALARARPQIFNSDQGSQFTSRDFTGCLQRAGVQISMDGRGRVFDNIFVERLWRTVKQEEVYLKDYQSVLEAVNGLRRFFILYNETRLHQALDYRTPAEIYFSDSARSSLYY
jgi:putative transposase